MLYKRIIFYIFLTKRCCLFEKNHWNFFLEILFEKLIDLFKIFNYYGTKIDIRVHKKKKNEREYFKTAMNS